MNRVYNFILRLGAKPNEKEEDSLKRQLLLQGTILFLLAGFIWGAIYFSIGKKIASIIPIGYGICSILSIVIFHFTHNYKFFLFSQLTLILILPFTLMFVIGGFVESSAVILWAFLCPVGAILFDSHRNAVKWFGVYLATIVLSGMLQPSMYLIQEPSSLIITIFFVMNISGVCTLVFFLFTYFVNEKTIFKEKADALLLNILPEEIAEILKNENRVIADQYEDASILFADIVNFTPISSLLTPVQVVELLNEVFSQFDTLVDKYDLEKIKTIGDCYMVVSGVPKKRQDHAVAIANLALDMIAYTKTIPKLKNYPIEFRIGINSGNVLAGVIGKKKFIYDLWGDAVNIASRMESHGKAGTIQITKATYLQIKEDFICDPQGIISIKGKGEMEVWHVLDKKK